MYSIYFYHCRAISEFAYLKRFILFDWLARKVGKQLDFFVCVYITFVPSVLDNFEPLFTILCWSKYKSDALYGITFGLYKVSRYIKLCNSSSSNIK